MKIKKSSTKAYLSQLLTNSIDIASYLLTSYHTVADALFYLNITQMLTLCYHSELCTCMYKNNVLTYFVEIANRIEAAIAYGFFTSPQ